MSENIENIRRRKIRYRFIYIRASNRMRESTWILSPFDPSQETSFLPGRNRIFPVHLSFRGQWTKLLTLRNRRRQETLDKSTIREDKNI